MATALANPSILSLFWVFGYNSGKAFTKSSGRKYFDFICRTDDL